MKLLLATLGSISIVGSGAAVLSNSTNNLVSTQTKASPEDIIIPSNLSKSSQIIEEYLANNQDSTIKEDILNSLFFNNKKIEINVLELKQYKNITNLYLMLTGDDLKDKLSEMYNNGLLKYDQKTQKFSFIEKTLSNYSWGVWSETHWYWFGGWRLHMNHEITQYMTTLLLISSSIGEFAEAAGTIMPEFAVAIAAVSVYLMANSYILSTCDHGNGSWIGYWISFPTLVCGSN